MIFRSRSARLTPSSMLSSPWKPSYSMYVPRVQFGRPADQISVQMDGTLVDSIAAVEAAWTSVAEELGQPAEDVIAATHGRRAIDNLRDLQPKLRRLTNEQMEPHVEAVSSVREAWTVDLPRLTHYTTTVREAYSEGSR